MDPEVVARCYPRHARSPFNVTGHPAVSVPVGFTPDSLPLSMQEIAPLFREDVAFQVAHAYECATPWKERHPTFA